jgi:hypothetical protein
MAVTSACFAFLFDVGQLAAGRDFAVATDDATAPKGGKAKDANQIAHELWESKECTDEPEIRTRMVCSKSAASRDYVIRSPRANSSDRWMFFFIPLDICTAPAGVLTVRTLRDGPGPRRVPTRANNLQSRLSARANGKRQ